MKTNYYVLNTENGYHAYDLHSRAHFTKNISEAGVYTDKFFADEQARYMKYFLDLKKYPEIEELQTGFIIHWCSAQTIKYAQNTEALQQYLEEIYEGDENQIREIMYNLTSGVVTEYWHTKRNIKFIKL